MSQCLSYQNTFLLLNLNITIYQTTNNKIVMYFNQSMIFSINVTIIWLYLPK